MGGKGTGITNQKERLDRINEVWDIICKHPKWSKERVISEFQFKYGTARRTVLDYIKVLEGVNKVGW